MTDTPSPARELMPDYMMSPEDLRKVFRLMPADLQPYYPRISPSVTVYEPSLSV